jgi:hypothetical protein
VLGLNQAELATRAQMLRDEALKMFSWRGAAIQRLLAIPDDRISAPRVSDAMLLRDEDATEQQQRTRTAASLLRLIFLLCLAGVLTLLGSFFLPISGAAQLQHYMWVGFLGLLGSAMTAAQQIIQGKDEGRIPGPFVLLSLVLAGTLSGLAAEPIYQYVEQNLGLKYAYGLVPYPLAFILGYSAERALSYFAGYPREHVSVRY